MSAALALVEVSAADPFGPVRVLNRMSAAGFALELDGRALVASPADKLSAAQRDFIRAHKVALVALLEDAETLHHALVVAGPAGLAWQAGTPADWDNTRLLAAGEVLYSDGRMVSAHGRRFAAESAPVGPDIPPDISAAPLAESQGTTTTCTDKTPDMPSDNPAPDPVDAKPTHAAPPICLPADYRPYRLLTRCDKPSPIYGPDGGDPVGCGNCGARWATEEVAP